MFALAIMITAGAYAQSTLTFTGETITGVNQPLSNSYFYTGCYSPVNIRINTDGLSGRSADVKFFLSGFFTLQDNVSTYSGFYTGDAFDTYYVFGNANGDDHLTGGTAASGDYAGDTYRYINGYNDSATELNDTNADFATFYIKPVMSYTSGKLDFYFLGANVNLDDSNVSSGENAEGTTGYTQYADMIDAVLGTWTYNFNTSYECPFKPYIASATYTSILGTDIAEAYSTDINDTYIQSLGTTDPSTIISSTANYSGTIVHTAGPNITSGNMTSWDIWTNQPIIVRLTGNDNQDISVDNIGIVTKAHVSLDNNGWSNVKVLTISGQYEEGLVFHNRIGNQGEKYKSGTNNYYDYVEINTFFYDTYAPHVTTATILTGDGFEYVALSGLSSVGASDDSNGWHANWTTNDDKFRIIAFSGTNSLNYGQTSTTGYNDDLNALYVQSAGNYQNFTMTKTGMTSNTDPEHPVATDTGAIMFTEDWAGYIYISDIAGNVTGVRVEVNVAPKVTFEVRGTPAFRDETHGANGDLTLTGDIRLGYLSGNTEWVFTHDSRNVSTDDNVVLNSAGTGSVSMVVPASGATFLAVFKGTGMLSIGFTGIWRNDISDTGTNIIDFRSGATNISINGPETTALFPNITYNAIEYIIAWDISLGSGEYDYINSQDLTLINNSLNIGITPSISYYDFDINDTINAIEQAIVLNYNNSNGWIYEYADGTSWPTKTAFDPNA